MRISFLFLFLLSAIALGGINITPPQDGGGGGGVDIPTGDGEWLRLDGTNGPMTGDLGLGGNDIFNIGTFTLGTNVLASQPTVNSLFISDTPTSPMVGDRNTCVGVDSCNAFVDPTSDINQCFGFKSCLNAEGTNNAVFGRESGSGLGVGNQRNFFGGNQTGLFVSGVNDSVVLGNFTLAKVAQTAITVSESQIIGRLSGNGLLSAQDVVAIGESVFNSVGPCASSTCALTNIVALGSEAQPTAVTASNEFYLGGRTTGITAGYLGSGGRAASTAASFTLGTSFATGTNRVGPDFNLVARGGTGSGAPGALRLQSAVAGASGTADQVASNRLSLSSTGADFHTHPATNVTSLEIDDGAGAGGAFVLQSFSSFSISLGDQTTAGANSLTIGRGSALAETGGGNTVVGGSAAAPLTTGVNNVVMGTAAASGLTTGSNNTILGRNACNRFTTASDNVCVGTSIANVTGVLVSAIGNILIGRDSGEVIQGNHNLFIGKEAGFLATTGDFNILLGYGAEKTSATAANEMGIGGDTGPITQVYIGEGGRSADAVATVTLGTSLTTGTDIAGPDFITAARGGTGAGAPGVWRAQTATAGVSGTADQTPANRLSLSDLGADFHNHPVSNVATLEIDNASDWTIGELYGADLLFRQTTGTFAGVVVASNADNGTEFAGFAVARSTGAFGAPGQIEFFNFAYRPASDWYAIETQAAGTGVDKNIVIDHLADGIPEAVFGTDGRTEYGGLVHSAQQSTTTTDATVTTNYTLALADNSAYQVEAFCVARRTDAADRASYKVIVTAYREAAGAATIQGLETDQHVTESDLTWDAGFVASGNNLLFQVTGAAAKTINWKCGFKYEIAA